MALSIAYTTGLYDRGNFTKSLGINQWEWHKSMNHAWYAKNHHMPRSHSLQVFNLEGLQACRCKPTAVGLSYILKQRLRSPELFENASSLGWRPHNLDIQHAQIIIALEAFCNRFSYGETALQKTPLEIDRDSVKIWLNSLAYALSKAVGVAIFFLCSC